MPGERVLVGGERGVEIARLGGEEAAAARAVRECRCAFEPPRVPLVPVEELEGFLERMKAVKTWIVRAKERAAEEGPYLQSPEQLGHYKRFSACINCMLCYAACPVVAHEPHFLGPAAIALAHRYNLDSRDEGQRERFAALRAEGGIYSCSYANECSEVCPKNVEPAGAIQQSKMLATLDWLRGLVLPGRG